MKKIMIMVSLIVLFMAGSISDAFARDREYRYRSGRHRYSSSRSSRYYSHRRPSRRYSSYYSYRRPYRRYSSYYSYRPSRYYYRPARVYYYDSWGPSYYYDYCRPSYYVGFGWNWY